LMWCMPETRGLSLEDIQRSFAMEGSVARRGRLISLLRRWVGGGGGSSSDGTSSVGNSQASESPVELRDVGDLLDRITAADGVEVASVEIGSDRVVRI
jgi:hypothetical protein